MEKARGVEDADKFIGDAERDMHRHRAECDADRARSLRIQWMLVGSSTLSLAPLFATGRVRVVTATAAFAIAAAGVGTMLHYDRRADASSARAAAAIHVIDRARQIRSRALIFGESAEDVALKLKCLTPV